VNKAVLAVVVPFLVVAAGATALYWWDRGAPPGFRPESVPVTSADISLDNRGVLLTGTAHYPVRVRQVGGGGASERFVFPVFPKGDVTGREIRVIVRSNRVPDEMLGFEDVSIEGFARPPSGQVPPDARRAFTDAGYHFAEGWVLVDAWDDPG
jgi:hypothetical protein